MQRRIARSVTFGILFLAILFWPHLGDACEYCSSTTQVCDQYQSVCTSYETQCTSYQSQCTSYSDQCTSYSYYCTAYDGYGNCLDYDLECDSYQQVCNGYTDVCVATQQVCTGYTDQCTHYTDQCNSYYYGDYVTNTGYVSNALTSFGLNVASVGVSSPYSNVFSTTTNSSGFYNTTNFIYDDSRGYLTQTICAQLDSTDKKCTNISVYDSCSSPTIRRDFELNVTELVPPNTVQISQVTDTKLTVNWTGYSGRLATGYYIAIASGNLPAACDDPSHAYSVNTSTYSYTGLAPDTLYTVSVCAHDSHGNISLSQYAQKRTMLAAPASFSASPGNAVDHLSWQPVSGASSYNIYRSTSPGGEGATPYRSVTGTSFTDTAVINGTTYYYQITAVVGGVETARSAEVYGTPLAPPSAPTGVTATAGGFSVTLNWNAAPTAASYQIYRGTSANGEGATPYKTVFGTTYSDFGLSSETTYFYKIAGVNVGGVGAISAEVSAKPLTTAIVTVNQSIFSTVGNWSLFTSSVPNYYLASSGNGSAVAMYTFSQLPAGAYRIAGNWPGNSNRASNTPFAVKDGNTVVATYPINQQIAPSDFTDQGISWKTISALQPIMSGSGSISVNNNANGNVMAGALRVEYLGEMPPTNVSATPADGRVTLSWSALAGASSYKIYRSTTAGGAGATPYQSGLTGTSFTDTAVSNGTTYYYQISALKGAKETARSLEMSAKPLAPPAAPTAFKATPVRFGVNLSWTASPTAASYNIYRGTSAGGEGAVPFKTGITGTTFADPISGSGGAVYYKITGVTVGGEGPASPEVSATPIKTVILEVTESGFTTTGSWAFEKRSSPSAYHESRGKGKSTATYSFAGLPAGRYKFATTWEPKKKRATNTPFTIKDGANLVVSIAVNQELTPSDFTDKGIGWKILAANQLISSGSATVSLSDNANQQVMASSVRVEYVGQ